MESKQINVIMIKTNESEQSVREKEKNPGENEFREKIDKDE